jgi:2-keto-4-pentenoate hydratase/2-oxohepta-3-ene-1,7-dioic acid hydratase in catechol pathway
MRLVTFESGGTVRLGAEWNEQVIDLNRVYALLLASRLAADYQATADRDLPPDMLRFLEGWPATRGRAHEALIFARDIGGPMARGVAWPRSEIRLRAPILNPRKLICLGQNYADHAAESNAPVPTEPILFSKFATSIIGPEDPIRLPTVSQQVDYEVELACIVGRGGRHIPKAQALEHVAGYTVFHDVSARDYQIGKPGKQWMAGKSFDTFAPMGPALVTADEVPNPHALDIRCTLSGEVVQSSNTRHLIFPIPEIIAYCSHIFTLEPGDVIATGTPGGIGYARSPQRFLQDGDVVVMEVSGVGILRNPVLRDT